MIYISSTLVVPVYALVVFGPACSAVVVYAVVVVSCSTMGIFGSVSFAVVVICSSVEIYGPVCSSVVVICSALVVLSSACSPLPLHGPGLSSFPQYTSASPHFWMFFCVCMCVCVWGGVIPSLCSTVLPLRNFMLKCFLPPVFLLSLSVFSFCFIQPLFCFVQPRLLS